MYQESNQLVPVGIPLIFPLREGTNEAASVICARFLEKLLPGVKSSISEIQVHERRPHSACSCWQVLFDLSGVSRLAFCHANPHITIRVFLYCFDKPIYYWEPYHVIELLHFIVRKEHAPKPFGAPNLNDRKILANPMQALASVDPAFGLSAPPCPDKLKLICCGKLHYEGNWSVPDYWVLTWHRVSMTTWKKVLNQWYTEGF